MLERASALAGLAPVEMDGFRMQEAGDFFITEISLPANDSDATRKLRLAANLPAMMGQVNAAKQGAGLSLMTGPGTYWLITERDQDVPFAIDVAASATSLRSSRCRIALEGPRTRDVLARCAAVDFHPSVLKPGQFVMTGMHHVPVLVHCHGPTAFHIYVLRTFAQSLWEFLGDAAHP